MSRSVVWRAAAVLALAAGGLGLGWWVFFHRPPAARGLVEINKGDRVVLVGGTLAERMQYFGHFETLLHSRFPGHELVVRDLGYAGDELVRKQERADGFKKHGHEMADHKPDVLIACFGFNESFAGEAGLKKFEEALENFLTQLADAPPNGHAPRLVLVSPIAHEDLGRPGLTDGRANNINLKRYTEAMARVAGRYAVPFVDLFTPSQNLMAQATTKLTVNGVHLTDAGDRQIAAVLDRELFGPWPAEADRVDYERLRREVNEKNRQFFYDYRAANGSFIYGAHKNNAFGPKNFPDEFAKLRRMIDKRDARVWAVAQGQPVPDHIDDSDTGELKPIVSSFKGEVRLTTPEEELRSFQLAPGFEVSLYASEVEFPDLKKPVAMAFDARGRMFVATMPSYPMYLPGEPVDDKIVVLEDTKGAGRADRATVFADGLYLPTGLAVGDGGLYVGCQPNVWFLKDTRGAGRADSREMILNGFGSADSHRAVNTFRWGPGGDLFFDEGVYTYTQVETPYGPLRNFNGGIYRYEPRTEKLDVYVSCKLGNPWGHAFDRWGQDFVADAADGENYYATEFAGQVDYDRKHPKPPPFFKKQHRPTCGCVIVSSRNFPDEMQGDYLLNNTMGFQGVLRYKLKEQGAGFTAEPAEPLLSSSDPNFRPVDVQFGPDGALYLCDWYNPVLGHLEFSVREPKRDRTRGRIWRVTYKGRPAVPPAKVAGATVPELLELLKAPEDRTRELAKLELRRHDTAGVKAELEKWVAGLEAAAPDSAHHLLEALWVCQHHDAVNEALLTRVLQSPEPRARAAAVRVLVAWRDRVPEPLGQLRALVHDPSLRVRLEAVRALSFFHDRKAREVAEEARAAGTDPVLDYALQETLATLNQRLNPGK
jgi:glucose/arabinose dehydrogenase